MPTPAVAVPGSDTETPSDRARRLQEVFRVAKKYGFEPVLNESPGEVAAEPIEFILRRQLTHLRLAGTLLDPRYVPAPTLAQTITIDGVPLVVEIPNPIPPLQGCLTCGGEKGETYTICAGCWTTHLRLLERAMLDVLPDCDERDLAGFKALTREQYRRAARRAPRLQPTRCAYLQPALEAIRQRSRAAVVRAHRTTLIETLRKHAEEEDLTPRERYRRQRRLHAAETSAPWNPRSWVRGLAMYSLDDVWLARLAAGEDEQSHGRDEDEYPLEWLPEDWLQAPDRVDTAEESAALVASTNTAAGTSEHAEALVRNALFDSYQSARARAWFEPGMDEYASWLAAELNARGGIAGRVRARIPEEAGDEDCERWDRWIDAILSGSLAPPPPTIEPIDAALCATWAASRNSDHGPTQLPRLGSEFPSGRLRWPQFVREEIEAENHAWGYWVEITEGEGITARVWCGDRPGERHRRLRRNVIAGIRRRRLERWARGEPAPATGRLRRALRPDGRWGIRNAAFSREWAEEIRADRRRRRFETVAHANAGIHATRLESGRFQTH
jgi:hypothetical protein